jgi:hypothetical protein
LFADGTTLDISARYFQVTAAFVAKIFTPSGGLNDDQPQILVFVDECQTSSPPCIIAQEHRVKHISIVLFILYSLTSQDHSDVDSCFSDLLIFAVQKFCICYLFDACFSEIA